MDGLLLVPTEDRDSEELRIDRIRPERRSEYRSYDM